MNLCIDCKHHWPLRSVSDAIWYNHKCACPETLREEKQDPVTGGRPSTVEQMLYCRDVNLTGTCLHHFLVKKALIPEEFIPKRIKEEEEKRQRKVKEPLKERLGRALAVSYPEWGYRFVGGPWDNFEWADQHELPSELVMPPMKLRAAHELILSPIVHAYVLIDTDYRRHLATYLSKSLLRDGPIVS